MNLKSEGTSLWRRNAGGKRKITKRRRMRRKRKNKNRRRRGELRVGGCEGAGRKIEERSGKREVEEEAAEQEKINKEEEKQRQQMRNKLRERSVVGRCTGKVVGPSRLNS